jgi:hypothetical protein
MKTKAIIIYVFLSLIIGLNARADLGYLITENDTFICKEIKSGLSNMRVTLVDGEKQKIDKENVKTFYVDGKKYDKMPVYLNGKPTGNFKFMELLSQRNGLKLYKFTFFCCGSWDLAQQKIEGAKEKTVLLVYKDDKFYLHMDKQNAKTLSEFFHLDGLTLE